ncbi:MAG TPA: universal stress protein, partial [Paludibacteraceae bacterium]|nr:universal stress protein [Paludibacteraceae bacterium]
KKLVEAYQHQQAQGIYKVLIAVGNPENGKILLRIAKKVLEGVKNTLSITVLHITPSTDTNPIYGEQFAEDSFKSIKEEAEILQIPIETVYKVADNVEASIVRIVNQQNFDFLLVGAGLSLSGIPFFKERNIFRKIKWLNKLINKVSQQQVVFYPGSLIKDKTKYFIEQSNCNVGIFVNRGFTDITSTVVLLYDKEDEFLLRYARRILKNNNNATVQIMDVNKVIDNNESVARYINEMEKQFPNAVRILKQNKINSNTFSKYSFMLISYQTWNKLVEIDKNQLANIPTTLIINKKISHFYSDGRRKQIVSLPDNETLNEDN